MPQEISNEYAKRVLNPDEDNVWRGAMDCETVSIVADCCRVAVKALNKQVKKKVIYEDVGYDPWHSENVYACICPSCNLHIITFTDSEIEGNDDFGGEPEKMFHSCLIHHGYIGLNNYCNRCGQKLNWKGK